MKRDIDLCRQLLIDIENHGTDCTLGALRSGLSPDAEERTRYHLRLLIDAGFVKEMDTANSGVACIRLTNSGHEFLDLARADGRWREAKWIVQEQTGGLSLTVLRTLLTKWAIEGTTRVERYRRWRRPHRTAYYRTEPPYRYEPYRVDSYRFERDAHVENEDELRLVRTHPDYRERLDMDDRFFERDGYTPYDREVLDTPIGVTLPVSVI